MWYSGFRNSLDFFIALLLLAFIAACEDVVEIDAPAEPPRLIIDALIRVDTSLSAIPVVVKVRETNSFFGEVAVTGLKQITMSNESSEYMVLLEEEGGSGIYEGVAGLGFLQDGEIILQIEHKDQRYLSRTHYVPAVPIDRLRQGEGTLFGGDETEVEVTFTDQPGREDYYLFDFDFDEYLVTEDEFYQGQEFSFSYFYDGNLEAGREVTIQLLGVDYSFYSYMDQLIEQAGTNSSPFQTPVATVKGNIINVTEIDNIDHFDNLDLPDNYALGYFAICQVFSERITIE